MHVVPVPVRRNNYAYLLVDKQSNIAAVVDPYDIPKVIAEADSRGLSIVANLTTHHHNDHAGGNHAFTKAYPNAPIYGGSKKVEAVTQVVKDQTEFRVGDMMIKCLATPCHTTDSICYYVTHPSSPRSVVFTGDTLFISGAGRFFEGTGKDMHNALSYLGTLPDDTTIYCGHEYTKDNLDFALVVDPDNEALRRLETIVNENKITTGLSTIGDEKQWNPFMRLHTAAIQKAAGKSSESAIIDALREMKTQFKD